MTQLIQRGFFKMCIKAAVKILLFKRWKTGLHLQVSQSFMYIWSPEICR